MTEHEETFQASGVWTAPPSAIVTPVGWFSRLLWPLMRYRAYGTGSISHVTFYGAGGSGGPGVATRPATQAEMDKATKEGGGGVGVSAEEYERLYGGGNGSPPNYITGEPGATSALVERTP